MWIAVGVVTADCLEERGYVVRGRQGKIKVIRGVEQRAGFLVDELHRAKEPGCELLWIINHPRVNRVSLNQLSSYLPWRSSLGSGGKLVDMSLVVVRLFMLVSGENRPISLEKAVISYVGFRGSDNV
jgi:hypothetical protein